MITSFTQVLSMIEYLFFFSQDIHKPVPIVWTIHTAAVAIQRKWRCYSVSVGAGAHNDVDHKSVTLTLSGQRHYGVLVLLFFLQDRKVFQHYKEIINFHGKGNPSQMLKCINPLEVINTTYMYVSIYSFSITSN